MSTKLAEWVSFAFFAALGALVFQQIATSMTEQGIASGGPYDNAASYPRGVAILMFVLLAVQLGRNNFIPTEYDVSSENSGLHRAIGLIVIFSVYLICLDWFGYYLSTPTLAAAVMWLCGARKIIQIVVAAMGMALTLALIFEHLLNVVLPGGLFGVHIPW